MQLRQGVKTFPAIVGSESDIKNANAGLGRGPGSGAAWRQTNRPARAISEQVDLVINTKTALGLPFPQSILLADRVIQYRRTDRSMPLGSIR